MLKGGGFGVVSGHKSDIYSADNRHNVQAAILSPSGLGYMASISCCERKAYNRERQRGTQRDRESEGKTWRDRGRGRDRDRQTDR